MIDVIIILGALALLIIAAYRGFSVILFAPVAAMLAVLVTDPAAVPTVFSGLFMEKVAGFLKLYFPVFLLGAVFGKLIEMSGFSTAMARGVLRAIGQERCMAATVLLCALLTYGGVSIFVVVFAAYPFAAEMFRRADIPKRLIPGTIALGAFTFTMDCLPGTPQIQNIIPTTFFGTTTWAAPVLGLIGAAFILTLGLAYLDWMARRAHASGEGYGHDHKNEPLLLPMETSTNSIVAAIPLVMVAIVNLALTFALPAALPQTVGAYLTGMPDPVTVKLSVYTGIWAVEGALLAGISTTLILAFEQVRRVAAENFAPAISGALLASFNTASEYGFGSVIAVLPGFGLIRASLESVPDPLVNEAVAITTLAGVTGSASGGLSITLGAMSDRILSAGNAAGIPPEVLHRVAAMASGGMDTLPHNGAVITLLAVTGLTHRQSYRDILAITGIKTMAVGVVIATYYLTGLV